MKGSTTAEPRASAEAKRHAADGRPFYALCTCGWGAGFDDWPSVGSATREHARDGGCSGTIAYGRTPDA